MIDQWFIKCPECLGHARGHCWKCDGTQYLPNPALVAELAALRNVRRTALSLCERWARRKPVDHNISDLYDAINLGALTGDPEYGAAALSAIRKTEAAEAAELAALRELKRLAKEMVWLRSIWLGGTPESRIKLNRAQDVFEAALCAPSATPAPDQKMRGDMLAALQAECDRLRARNTELSQELAVTRAELESENQLVGKLLDEANEQRIKEQLGEQP
jgi:hypothetical protein